MNELVIAEFIRLAERFENIAKHITAEADDTGHPDTRSYLIQIGNAYLDCAAKARERAGELRGS